MLNKKNDPDMSRVPLWKKMNLTVEEAAEYSGIGISKIKEISNQEHLVCPLPSTLSHITRIVTVIITGIKSYPRNQRIQKSAEPSNAKQLKYIEKHILVIH